LVAAAATTLGIGAAGHKSPSIATPAHNTTSAIPRRCPNLNVIPGFIRRETL
jgi:hypothetical protein